MTLTPALLCWLQTEEAGPWLRQLTADPPGDANLIAVLTGLRRHLPGDKAAALVEQARLRRAAKAKFPAAAQLFFERTRLEQASPASVAAYTASRFGALLPDVRPWITDLGCGLGGDALALAAWGNVVAVDTDLLALALTRANAGAVGLGERIHVVQADAGAPAWDATAAWADPGRRTGERRLFDPEQLQPPLHVLLQLQQTRSPDLGIKLMPGLPHSAIPAGVEAEWISLHGELKEAVLWLGGLARAEGRRATVLPSGASLAAAGVASAVHKPGSWLYEPDPAVIRAGAVGDLAAAADLWQIDGSIAYLSGDILFSTPFARAWRIIEHAPFDLKALNRRLLALDGEVVAVKKRGSPIEPEAFRRRLHSRSGGQPLVVVLTRHANRPWMLICESPTTEAAHA